MIVYNKLWVLLKSKGMKRIDLLEVISSSTLAKLGKDEIIKTDTIEKICNFLDCQPADIMENVNQKTINAAIKKLDTHKEVMLDEMANEGITPEQAKKEMQDFLETILNGKSLEEYISAEVQKQLKEESPE